MDTLYCRFCAAAALLLALFVLLSPTAFLVSENRPPSAFSLAAPDGFFTDRLPFRDTFLCLYRDIELALGKNAFAGTVVCRDGYLYTEESLSSRTLQANLASIRAFSDRTSLPLTVALVGSKADALPTLLPRFYEPDRTALWKTLADSGLKTVPLLPVLRENGCAGKYVYYRGDHHLTSLGAYYAYTRIAPALGCTPARDFTVQVVCTDFSGSDARRMRTRTDDRIALFRYAGDDALSVYVADTDETRPLYDLSALRSADPYAVFPAADAGRVTVTGGKNRLKLLMLCDSYGDALAPFLARHFDLEIIDPRYFHGSVQALAREGNFSAVLFYFGMDTLAARDVLYPVRY